MDLNNFEIIGLLILRALRSRSLRDGSLSHEDRFATFVRSCSALRASKKQLKISHLKSACLNTPLVVGIKLILLFLKFVYFMKTSTINIHIRKFLMRNSESAYLFTFINIWKHVSSFILNFHQKCLLYVNNNNKYSHLKFFNAKFCFSILSYPY